MEDNQGYDWWLGNNSRSINDILITLQNYLQEIKVDNLKQNKNIIWQFTEMLLKYIRFFTFLKNEWEYHKNNSEVYELTKDLLWMLLKDVTVISSNIDEYNPNLTRGDEYLGFMKKLRNILHHQRINDKKVTLKSLCKELGGINQDIIDNSPKFLIKKILKNGSTDFWNKGKNDYISICKLKTSENNTNEIEYEGIDNFEQIDEELISYFFTDHINFERPYHGELNSLDNFVCTVYISEHYILHIKSVPVLYWGLEKIKNILCQ
jgi:hypothetical protein